MSKTKSTNKVVANAMKAVVKNGLFSKEIGAIRQIRDDKEKSIAEAKKYLPKVKSHFYKLINEAKDLHGAYDKCIWNARNYKRLLGEIRTELDELQAMAQYADDDSLSAEIYKMKSNDLFGSFRSV